MTKQEIKQAWQETPWCIECDNPLDTVEEAYEHPEGYNEVVCESCA